jgi:ATP-dependent Clp protease ATP-binding subunit ClpB
MEAARNTFRPEFMNRIDEYIVFQQLDRDQISRIVRIQLDRVQKRLSDRKITLKVTESAIQLLASLGYDPNYGARPVKRVIQQSVENELARSILRGDFKEEDTILIDSDLTSVAGSSLPQQKLSFRRLQSVDSNQAADADPFAYAQGQEN